MLDLEPDWPFEPAPAHVRVGELLAMQMLLGVCVSATVLRYGWSLDRLRPYTVGFVNALCVSFLVPLLREWHLGAQARFAPSGRFAVGLTGIAGGLVLAEEWLGHARDYPLPPAYPCAVLAVFPFALGLGMRNLLASRQVRGFWGWVPLTLGLAQFACLFVS